MIYVTNAFSLNMIAGRVPVSLTFVEYTADMARELLDREQFQSAIGHTDLAAVVANDLGVEIQANRISVKLDRNDVLIVAQYSGPRLPEGATQLPDDAEIRYYFVRPTMDHEVV